MQQNENDMTEETDDDQIYNSNIIFNNIPNYNLIGWTYRHDDIEYLISQPNYEITS